MMPAEGGNRLYIRLQERMLCRFKLRRCSVPRRNTPCYYVINPMSLLLRGFARGSKDDEGKIGVALLTRTEQNEAFNRIYLDSSHGLITSLSGNDLSGPC